MTSTDCILDKVHTSIGDEHCIGTDVECKEMTASGAEQARTSISDASCLDISATTSQTKCRGDNYIAENIETIYCLGAEQICSEMATTNKVQTSVSDKSCATLTSTQCRNPSSKEVTTCGTTYCYPSDFECVEVGNSYGFESDSSKVCKSPDVNNECLNADDVVINLQSDECIGTPSPPDIYCKNMVNNNYARTSNKHCVNIGDDECRNPTTNLVITMTSDHCYETGKICEIMSSNNKALTSDSDKTCLPLGTDYCRDANNIRTATSNTHCRKGTNKVCVELAANPGQAFLKDTKNCQTLDEYHCIWDTSTNEAYYMKNVDNDYCSEETTNLCKSLDDVGSELGREGLKDKSCADIETNECKLKPTQNIALIGTIHCKTSTKHCTSLRDGFTWTASDDSTCLTLPGNSCMDQDSLTSTMLNSEYCYIGGAKVCRSISDPELDFAWYSTTQKKCVFLGEKRCKKSDNTALPIMGRCRDVDGICQNMEENEFARMEGNVTCGVVLDSTHCRNLITGKREAVGTRYCIGKKKHNCIDMAATDVSRMNEDAGDYTCSPYKFITKTFSTDNDYICQSGSTFFQMQEFTNKDYCKLGDGQCHDMSASHDKCRTNTGPGVGCVSMSYNSGTKRGKTSLLDNSCVTFSSLTHCIKYNTKRILRKHHCVEDISGNCKNMKTYGLIRDVSDSPHCIPLNPISERRILAGEPYLTLNCLTDDEGNYVQLQETYCMLLDGSDESTACVTKTVGMATADDGKCVREKSEICNTDGNTDDASTNPRYAIGDNCAGSNPKTCDCFDLYSGSSSPPTSITNCKDQITWEEKSISSFCVDPITSECLTITAEIKLGASGYCELDCAKGSCKSSTGFQCTKFEDEPNTARTSDVDQTCIILDGDCRNPDSDIKQTINNFLCIATDYTCYPISADDQRKQGGLNPMCSDICWHKYWCKTAGECLDYREDGFEDRAKTSISDTTCVLLDATKCRVEDTGIVSEGSGGLTSAAIHCQSATADDYICKDMTLFANIGFSKTTKGSSDVCAVMDTATKCRDSEGYAKVIPNTDCTDTTNTCETMGTSKARYSSNVLTCVDLDANQCRDSSSYIAQDIDDTLCYDSTTKNCVNMLSNTKAYTGTTNKACVNLITSTHCRAPDTLVNTALDTKYCLGAQDICVNMIDSELGRKDGVMACTEQTIIGEFYCRDQTSREVISLTETLCVSDDLDCVIMGNNYERTALDNPKCQEIIAPTPTPTNTPKTEEKKEDETEPVNTECAATQCKEGNTCLTISGSLARISALDVTCTTLVTGECRTSDKYIKIVLADATKYCIKNGEKVCTTMGDGQAKKLSDGSCLNEGENGVWENCAVFDTDKGQCQFCDNNAVPGEGETQCPGSEDNFAEGNGRNLLVGMMIMAIFDGLFL